MQQKSSVALHHKVGVIKLTSELIANENQEDDMNN
jgi:hypothetical protein